MDFSGDWFSRPGNLAAITSYESLPKVLRRLQPGQRFDAAIIDESHYVKNLEAKRSQLVFGKNGVPGVTNRHWCTTGTPTPNGLASELWTTLFTYGATTLSFWDFAKKFCVVEETGYGTVIKGTNMDPLVLGELREILSKKMLRRTAKDVNVQLPKISFSTVMVPPGPVDLRQTTFWKYAIPEDKSQELAALIEAELGIMEGIIGRDDGSNVLSNDVVEVLKAQSKSISTLRKYTALQKLEPACELIAQELDANAYNKCVIFAHHRDLINGAARLLHRFYPKTLYGGSSPSTTERNIKNFQNPNHKVRVFIGQISAAGTSISLSAANHIFFLEESFVPDDNLQASMRCGGVNQPNPIFVRTFCLENSYDYRLQNIIREKMKQSAEILAPTKTLEELF